MRTHNFFQGKAKAQPAKMFTGKRLCLKRKRLLKYNCNHAYTNLGNIGLKHLELSSR